MTKLMKKGIYEGVITGISVRRKTYATVMFKYEVQDGDDTCELFQFLRRGDLCEPPDGAGLLV